MKAAVAAFVALAVLAALPARAAPLLFHDHGHGLSFSSDGRALLAPSHGGLAAYEGGAWWEAPGPAQGFSGFSVAERSLYASGHPAPQRAGGDPAGLMRSRDGGRTWQRLALGGEADFPLVAAGYRSGAIYVLATRPNSAMPAPGLYLTRDEGRSWRRASARGLEDEIHALAAHPAEPGTLAAGSDRGLFLSRDGGERFRRLADRGPVTAVSFDHGGERLYYARALSSEVVAAALEGGERRPLRLPALAHGDYVTCIAHSPVDERVLAFATRRRDVFLSEDGGRSWRHLASAGEARDEGAAGEAER